MSTDTDQQAQVAPPQTEDAIFASLSSEFEPDAEAAAGSETPSETASEADGEASTDEQAESVGEESKLPSLAELQALAAERRAARGTKEPETPPAPAGPDMGKLAEQLAGATAFREAVEAFAKGDASKIAELTGKDEAALYTQWTDHAIRGDGAKTDDRVRALEAEIAELKGQKPPEDVLTVAKLQEIERARAEEQNRATYTATVADEAKYPTLALIDAELALSYGHQAEAMLSASDLEPTLELIAQYAEQIASSKLGRLRAQTQGASAKDTSGTEDTKPAGAGTGGERRASGAIDNRAASTTAAAAPAPDDEAAWERRMLDIARGANA